MRTGCRLGPFWVVIGRPFFIISSFFIISAQAASFFIMASSFLAIVSFLAIAMWSLHSCMDMSFFIIAPWAIGAEAPFSM